MPAPVTFNLSLAPFPVTFEGTPQEWAEAVVDRLTIAPSEPWSSFQNGGIIPTSNVGPVLYNGVQWMVWNVSTGAYENLVVDGGGLISNTVPLSALSTSTPGGLFYYDASGLAATLAPATAPTGPTWISAHSYVAGQYVTYSGLVYLCILNVASTTPPPSDATHWTAQSATTTGSVLTQSSAGLPVWQPLPVATGGNNFEVTGNTDTNIPTGPSGPTTTLPFNSVTFINGGVTYNTGTYAVSLGANQTWFLYCTVQFNYQISNIAPAWSSGNSYSVGAYVIYSSTLYQCTSATSGTTPPPSDTAHWILATSSYNVQMTLQFNSSAGPIKGYVDTFNAVLGRGGIANSAIMPPQSSAQTVTVSLTCVESNSSTTALTFEANANDTRFGGFRIA